MLRRERDAIYGDVFPCRVARMGIGKVVCPFVQHSAQSVCGEHSISHSWLYRSMKAPMIARASSSEAKRWSHI